MGRDSMLRHRTFWVCVLFCFGSVTASLWSQTESASTDRTESSPAAVNAYTKAATLQNNAAYDLATEAWRAYLKKYPEDVRVVDARYNLGMCLMELKQLAEARLQLQACLASSGGFDRREDAMLNLGWVTYKLGMQDQPQLFEEARKVFDDLLKDYPNGKHRDQTLFLRGESIYLGGDRASAVKAYQRLVEQSPDSQLLPNTFYALGVAYEELGQQEAASRAYDEFLQRFSDHALVTEVRMRKAETQLQSGDFAAAEQGFASVSKDPDFADADYAWYRQAFSVVRQERFSEAGDLFAGLVRKFPASKYADDATLAAARAYYRAEDDESAAIWFERLASDAGPNGSEAIHWRARMMLKQDQAAAALSLVEQRLPVAQQQEHSFYVQLLMDQADAIYEIPARRGEAIGVYLRIVQDFPGHELAAQALYNAAFAAMEVRDYARAAKLAEQFQDRFSEHKLVVDAKQVLAESQLQLGDTTLAARHFDELIKQQPAEANKWRLRKAIALYTKQDYAAVIGELQPHLASMKAPQTLAEANYLIGMSHLATNRLHDAHDALQAAVRAEPDWQQGDQVLMNLSRAQHKLSQSAAAIETIEKLRLRFPSSKSLDRAYYRLGEYAYATAEYDRASGAYEKMLAEFPSSRLVPYAQYGLGWSKLRQQDLDAAETAFSIVLTDFAEHSLARQARYARAMTRQQAGRFKSAIEDVDLFLQGSEPGKQMADALYVKGLSLIGQQDYEQAIPVLESTLQQPEFQAGDKGLYELAWAHKSLGQHQDATAVFLRLASTYEQSPLAAEASYHVGETNYAAKDYTAAVRAYEEAKSRLRPGEELGEQLLYKLGWSHYQLQNYQEALSEFEAQATRYPRGELVGDAYFMQGECQFQLAQYRSSLDSYTEAQKRELSSDQISTLTQLHAGQAAAQLELWELSHDWLLGLRKQNSDSAYRHQVDFELAVAQQNLGNTDGAAELFTEVAELAAGELGARSRFMLGEVLYAKGQYVTAIREFRKVMFGFDADTAPAVAPWQAKAGFEAGQCAGIVASQQQDRTERDQYLELARRFFQYVITRFPDAEEARAATEQLKKYGA